MPFDEAELPPGLKPAARPRVMDLVAECGLDVSDWSNYKGGSAGAAKNPRYCYEWAFVRDSVVVLNLWYGLLRSPHGTVFTEVGYRQTARDLAADGAPPVQIQRARRADAAVRIAFEEQRPVRAIINHGARRRPEVRATSSVYARLLDAETWHVSSYDFISGNAVVVRGERSQTFVDQFSVQHAGEAERRRTTREEYARDARVRAAVLARAAGLCEHCRVPGFEMADGARYLETHHVIPLSEGGADTVHNVLALCPDHHRRAHHGIEAGELRIKFQAYLSGFARH